jgi:hypothetical protein
MPDEGFGFDGAGGNNKKLARKASIQRLGESSGDQSSGGFSAQSENSLPWPEDNEDGTSEFPDWKGISIIKCTGSDKSHGTSPPHDGHGNEIRYMDYTEFEAHPDRDEFPDVYRAKLKITFDEFPDDAHKIRQAWKDKHVTEWTYFRVDKISTVLGFEWVYFLLDHMSASFKPSKASRPMSCLSDVPSLTVVPMNAVTTLQESCCKLLATLL